MAVTAALKFTQSPNTNVAGKSFKATVGGGAVTIGNNDNTGVNNWIYVLLDVPRGSAVVPGTLSSGASPTTTLTPDVPGSYRIQETISGPGGIASQTRNIVVANELGWILPGYLNVAEELDFPDPSSPNARGWAAMLDVIFLSLQDFVIDYNEVIDIDNDVLSLIATEIHTAVLEQGKATTKEAELQTTDNADHTLASYNMASVDDGSFALDVYVLGVMADLSVCHWYKKSRAWLSAGGTLTAGAQKDVDDEEIGTPPPGTWVVALNHSGQVLRVRVNSDNDDVTWYVLTQNLQVIPVV